MKPIPILLLVLILLLASKKLRAAAENEKISPKLDFDESKETSIGTGQNSSTSSGKSSKHSPKIQGVRVTVDTGKVKKSTADSDSKESVEIVESKNKKKVEIHTDITVEIADGDDSNATSPEGDKGENDASVPIFKGRTSTTHKPRKSHDPRVTPWIPPRSDGGVFHTAHVNPNFPVFPRTDDEGIYRNVNHWNNFVPITSVWTTERTHYPPRSYDYLYRAQNYQTYTTKPQWKPCFCVSGVHRDYRDNSVQRKTLRDSGIGVGSHVSGKLDSPFSS